MGRIYKKAYTPEVCTAVTAKVFNDMYEDIANIMGSAVRKKFLLNHDILNHQNAGDFDGAYALVLDFVNDFYTYAHEAEIFCRFDPSKAGGSRPRLCPSVTDPREAAAYVDRLAKDHVNQVKSWVIGSMENFLTKLCQEATSTMTGAFVKVEIVKLDNDGREMYVEGQPVVEKVSYRRRAVSLDAKSSTQNGEEIDADRVDSLTHNPAMSLSMLMFKNSLSATEKAYLNDHVSERVTRKTMTPELRAEGRVAYNRRLHESLADKAEYYLSGVH